MHTPHNLIAVAEVSVMRRLARKFKRWIGIKRFTDYEPMEDSPYRIPGGRWASFNGWSASRGGQWDK